MDGMMEGFSRVFIKSFRNEAEEETTKVSKEIDIEVSLKKIELEVKC